jgi:hypothetical protein
VRKIRPSSHSERAAVTSSAERLNQELNNPVQDFPGKTPAQILTNVAYSFSSSFTLLEKLALLKHIYKTGEKWDKVPKLLV